MLLTAPKTEEQETMADLLKRLGGIAPSRVRMQPYPGTASVQDVIRIERRENRLFELVDGVLVEKVIGFLESGIGIVLATALRSFVSERDLGVVSGADGMIRFPENLVRIPDIAFVPWDQFPEGEVTNEPVPAVVPSVAVEVLSPGNTAGEMSRKLREYFKAGVQLVWFVDPPSMSVTVFTSPGRSKNLSSADTLEGGKVLPGFRLPVAELFAPLKRKKRRNGR